MAATKTIPGFPNYSITDNGEVWSFYKKKYLVNICCKNGYMKIALFKNKKYYYKYIHGLVLDAFVGPCPDGMECCHNNGDKQDNRLENLRWDTHKNNIRDAIVAGKHSCLTQKGEKHNRSKLTEQDVLLIRGVYNKKLNGYIRWSQHQLAKKFSISQSQISVIINKKSWKHI